MKTNCKVCNSTGWVCGCTVHKPLVANKPWEGEGSCGCGDLGNNCLCNPNGEVDFIRIYASTNEAA